MRKPKPLTQERLEKSALAYLERFATSRENLRRVLKRKLIRAEPDQRPGFAFYIDGLIEKLETLGYLNDETYADGRVAALRRHGLSARAIGMKLQAKGIARDLVTAKLEADASTDLEAAWALARRRRLGPYRPEETRRDFREKDMAVMGRAGFDYGTARGVIEASSEMDL